MVEGLESENPRDQIPSLQGVSKYAGYTVCSVYNII